MFYSSYEKLGKGVIINVSSVPGLQYQKLVPPYAAGKGAVLSLTRKCLKITSRVILGSML
ncbi:MAG TPA: hypothetical protein DDZ97_06905 [Deltaproteobacteria bacterium]|nr:hypothetical protein [Deltaproteobacteria bacterium]